MNKNHFRLRVPVVCLALLILIGCSDAQATKIRHVEQGDAYMAQGKYAEAVLEYRNAVRIDARFGEARYKLAKAYQRTENVRQAVREYLAAAELLPDRADAQLDAAVVSLSSGDFDGARKYAEAALKVDAKNLDAQLTLAQSLAGLKDTEAAIRELEEAMQLAPGDSRPLAALGTVEAGRGNPAAAEAAFRRALEIDPKSVPSRIVLAHFLWAQGRAADTERALNDALAIDENDDMVNRMLSVFYLQQNRADDAETPLLRLVNAKDSNATLILADLYARTGRVPAARSLYDALGKKENMRSVSVARLASLDYLANQKTKAYAAVDAVLKSEPNNTHLLTLKAQWLLSDRRLEEAVTVAQKATQSDPTSAASHYVLGMAHSALLNGDDAVKSLNEAVRLNPRLGPVRMDLARILLTRGDVEAALTHARFAREQMPDSGEARLVLSRALLANQDLAGAEGELKTLLRDAPGSAQVHSVYGQLLMAKSDKSGAERELDKALALNPADVEALTGRLAVDAVLKNADEGRARIARALKADAENADLLLVAGRFEWGVGNAAAAEKYLRATIEKDPSRLDAYTALGQLYVSQQRLDQARAEFERIAQRRPDSVPARTMIGMILDAQGKPDESRKIYESILAGGNRAPIAANNLAYQYADRSQQLDVALNLAQSAKAELPDSPEVSDTLGWVYYKRGLADLAIPPLEFSVSKDPQRPEYLVHLGLSYAKGGQPDKAREMLQRALSINPRVDGAAEARNVLASLGTR